MLYPIETIITLKKTNVIRIEVAEIRDATMSVWCHMKGPFPE